MCSNAFDLEDQREGPSITSKDAYIAKRHDVTGASRVIPQPTTNPADTCLTSRIERDGVC